MSKWKGPWKCEKCGDTFTPDFGRKRIYDGLCHYGSGASGICLGKLIPYERRAADERVRELVEALRKAHNVLRQVPSLAQGPSRELWDGIMCDVLEAKRETAAILRKHGKE